VSRFENLCPGCFRPKSDDPVCPRCGYDEGQRRPPLALDHRTLLDGRYLIGRVLGKPGGFGVAYADEKTAEDGPSEGKVSGNGSDLETTKLPRAARERHREVRWRLENIRRTQSPESSHSSSECGWPQC